MPFDGIVTKAVTNELHEKIVGGRINKIYQPTKTEIVLTIRHKRENFSLLLSIHPAYARFHLTEDIYRNPDEPPMFCMLLRKHLAGAIIEDINQTDLERIVSIEVRGLNEIGDQERKTLVLEIMGRHSNIVLLNEDKSTIINCIKHVPPYQNRYRSLVPGAPYIQPPPQNKLNLLATDGETFLKKLDFNQGKMDRQIVQAVTGISPFIAKELVHRVNLGSENVYKEVFEQFQSEVINHQFRPAIFRQPKEDYHVMHITYLKDGADFPSTNQMLDAFYSNKAERDRVKQQARDLEKLIKNEIDKNKRKIAIHEKTLKKAKHADTYQKYGELLTANLHTVQRGDKHVSVIDYYDPEQKNITIDLQTDKTPSENAQIFFKKYRKLEAAQKSATKELKKTAAELDYLDNLIQQIETGRDEDIEDIREELADQGYIRKQVKKRKKRKKPTPEEFTASDGTLIYVGHNNKQNEYVTHKLAHRHDIWLHALNIPGSHVVIKSNHPSEETILEAAQLAAFYSKAGQSASVPIDYTEVRHVKKPSGAKPGFVTYTNQKTLSITPDESIVQALRKNNSNMKNQ